MKRVVLAIAAALVLIAVPAAAQYETDTSNQQPTTTTTDQPTEVRTNPVVPTHSADPGLTAQGTVVSWNDDEVVLRTSTGLTHFKLMPNTVGSRTFTEGQALAIDFQRNEQGVLLAKQIRSADLAPTQPQGITTPGAAAAGEAVEEAVEDVGEAIQDTAEAVEEEVDEALDTETATTTETTMATDTSLPATGSNAPLAGLLGLLALGGAAAIRRL